jgi:hypothetical protein
MANWISCTRPSGDKILVNFDNATVIHRDELNDQTQISFLGEKETLIVWDTIKQLSDAGLMT